MTVQKQKNIRSGYATTDNDIQLHWRVIGEGPPIVCCNGVGVSTFFWKYIIEHYQETHSILVWDYRGHGLSQRGLDPYSTDMSVERHAKDLLVILEKAFPASSEPYILIGHSMGCQVILETYRLLREKISHLVLLLGTAGEALSTFGNFSHSPLVFRAIRRLLLTVGPRTNHISRPLLSSPIAWPFTHKFALVDPLYTQKEDFTPYLDHMATMDSLLFIQAVWSLQKHSAWELLPEITCPAMIFAAEKDTFTPIDCSKKIAESIPNSTFVYLSDASHAALIEQPEIINYRLDQFLEAQNSL